MNALMEITTAMLMLIVPIHLLLTNAIVTTDTEETEGYAKVGCVLILRDIVYILAFIVYIIN